MAGHVASSRVAPPPRTLPKSTSGALAGLFRRHHRLRREKWCRTTWARLGRAEMFRPFLGPQSSSSERLKQLCVFGGSSSERVLFGASRGDICQRRLQIGMMTITIIII
eukprot:3469672-Alexandrium_andersonii.AAC.1